MELLRIRDTADPRFAESMEYYKVSFPEHEQREAQSQRDIMGENDYCFYIALHEGRPVGSILCWETEEFIYVEHFYVYPSERGRGFGSEILRILGEKGSTVILEIDPPADSVSIRRKAFYNRCGFKENPYPHVHPPYHERNSGHKLVIMSYPSEITQREYDSFNSYLKDTVMRK